MSHGLDLAGIDLISCLDKTLSVSCYDRSSDVCFFRKLGIDLPEDRSYDFKRITFVIAVMLIDELLIRVDKCSLGRSRARVDAEENSSLCF